ncbi:MAG: flagellar biosynthesis anti-sigma factor FlgM [Acidobacteriota bacterium]|nr:flagellar biosynthesis anti-sigma factor FlgM [Acidobacteriota bacterium]
MSLRIENQGQQPAVNNTEATRAASAASKASTASSSATSSVDTASIGSASGELSGDLSIRQDRVDALRAQVESGTYQPDPHAIASAMFQNYFGS